MIKIPNPRILPRGRVATWTIEKLEKMSIPDLRALLDNAERLKEAELAVMVSAILDKRPHGHTPARKRIVKAAKAAEAAAAEEAVSGKP
jgi:hypothetical protein